MKYLAVILLIGLWGTPVCSYGAQNELHWSSMLASSYRYRPSTTTAFESQEKQSEQQLDTLLRSDVSYQSWQARLSLYSSPLYRFSDGSQWRGVKETSLVINELYWSTTLDDMDIRLGKQRLDWGVGYAYRPLDLFLRYDEHALGLQVENGVGVASVTKYDTRGEWTFLYTDARLTKEYTNPYQKAQRQKGVGVRRYMLIGSAEYQWVGYYDDVRRGLLAMSLVNVFDEQWEFHSSMVAQRRYLQYSLTSYSQMPQPNREALQALIGMTWSQWRGISVIAEYWYDSRAWSQSQWQYAIEHKSSPASASYSRGFWHDNIVQHNLSLHWQLNTKAWIRSYGWQNLSALEKLTPSVDALFSVQDGGWIVSPKVVYQGDNNGAFAMEFSLAARFYFGNADSVYSQINANPTIVMTIKGYF